jgi:hypothetical protein
MKRLGPKKKLYPSQLKQEWKSLGRRAMRLWRMSGGLDPEIDLLFKQMDAVDHELAKLERPPRAVPRLPLGARPQ